MYKKTWILVRIFPHVKKIYIIQQKIKIWNLYTSSTNTAKFSNSGYSRLKQQ